MWGDETADRQILRCLAWGCVRGDLDTPGPNDDGVMPLMPDFSSGAERLLIDVEIFPQSPGKSLTCVLGSFVIERPHVFTT